MATEIKVPSVGESITEGTISRWFKKDGEIARTGEPLFELETEKATTEVPAPAAGVVHIAVPEGQTVAVGATVARIEEAQPGMSRVSEKKDGRASASPAPATSRQATPASPQPEPLLSPAARRLALEHGVDIQALAGTGPSGRNHRSRDSLRAKARAP